MEELRDDLTALNLSNASNMDQLFLGKNLDLKDLSYLLSDLVYTSSGVFDFGWYSDGQPCYDLSLTTNLTFIPLRLTVVKNTGEYNSSL